VESQTDVVLKSPKATLSGKTLKVSKPAPNVTPDEYLDIAKANGLADPDKIKAGQHPAWVEDVRPRNKAVRIAVRDQTCCVVPKWHYRYIFE